MRGRLRQMADMSYSDDEQLDQMMGSEIEPPEFPMGLQFSLSRDDLAKICDGDCAPDMKFAFAAMGTATSVDRGRDDCRIEVELAQMAGSDGKFVEMERAPGIYLTGPEMEKLDLCDECERGDTVHIIGTARVERTSSPRFGDDMVTLQIIELAVEDESEESRDGG